MESVRSARPRRYFFAGCPAMNPKIALCPSGIVPLAK
jgi:hypothetical protein